MQNMLKQKRRGLSMENPEINKIIQIIEHTQPNEVEYKKKLCYQLIEISMQKSNKNGIACAMYILAQINYRQGKFKQSLEFLNRGDSYVKGCGKYALRIDYDILFGLLYCRLGNEQQSFEFFLKCIGLAKIKRDNHRLCQIYHAIAHAYQMFGFYEEALNYYAKEERCFTIIQKLEKDTDYSYKRFLMQCHYCLCYIKLNQIEKAENIMVQLSKEYINLSNEQSLPYYYLYCRLLIFKEQIEEAKTYLKIFFDAVQKMELYVDYFDDCIDLVEILIDRRIQSEAKMYINAIEKMSTKAMSEEYRFKYYDAKIRYGLTFLQYESMNEDFEKYLEVGERLEEVFRMAKYANLKNRKRMVDTIFHNSHMKTDMHYLKERSEHDPLTNLANRSCLNDYLEKSFKKAMEKQYTIGIDVLDVDYFKQYNDKFGHLFGDQCLIQIADTMREVAQDYFLARFGGDEFFIVFINTNTDKIVEVANQLKDTLYARGISQSEETPYQCITISQGLVNEIPKSGQTVSDFIHCADMALYRGKKLTKNAIFLGEIT